MDSAVYEQCSHLQQDDYAFLERISRNMPLLADLSRADLQMYCRSGKDEALVIDQARPHSVPSLYSKSLVGQRVSLKGFAALYWALVQSHSSWQTQGSFPGPSSQRAEHMAAYPRWQGGCRPQHRDQPPGARASPPAQLGLSAIATPTARDGDDGRDSGDR